MNRTDLIEVLSAVSHALATQTIVPSQCCLFFDGLTVTAYDGVIALRAPCEVDVEGGLHGRLLLGFLDKARGREAVFSYNESKTVVKCGRSRLEVALALPDELTFDMPDDSDSVRVEPSVLVMAAFKDCAVSVGTDPAHPWRLGMTIRFPEKGKYITIYSSDNLSVSRAVVPFGSSGKAMAGMTMVLPPAFCKRMLAVASKDNILRLLFDDGWVKAEFESGVELFARTVDVDSKASEQYVAIFDAVLPTVSHLVDVPEGFGAAVARAIVPTTRLTDMGWRGNLGDYGTTLTVADGSLTMVTKSSCAKVKDRFKTFDHPDMVVTCPPHFIARALVSANRMAFSDVCIRFVGSSAGQDVEFNHIISVVKQEK